MTDEELIRNDSRTVRVTFTDSSSDPYDLTGGTCYLTINASGDPANDDDAILQKIETDIENPTEGIVTFRLMPADTNIEPGIYWMDAQLTDSEGNKISRKRSQITVIPDITRS